METARVQDGEVMKIPKSTKEQLVVARQLGHVFAVATREDQDGHTVYKISCTCGYVAANRRSRSAASGVMTWHMGKILADYFENPERVNGA